MLLHTIGWDKMTVLKSNITEFRERLVTEAVFIESTENTCNRSDSTPVPDIWKILLALRPIGRYCVRNVIQQITVSLCHTSNKRIHMELHTSAQVLHIYYLNSILICQVGRRKQF